MVKAIIYYWRVCRKQIFAPWWNNLIEWVCYGLAHLMIDTSGPVFPVQENGWPYSYKTMVKIHKSWWDAQKVKP